MKYFIDLLKLNIILINLIISTNMENYYFNIKKLKIKRIACYNITLKRLFKNN